MTQVSRRRNSFPPVTPAPVAEIRTLTMARACNLSDYGGKKETNDKLIIHTGEGNDRQSNRQEDDTARREKH